ncbi:MAG: class I tRNA ligase family protein [Planctomycetota bacterium]
MGEDAFDLRHRRIRRGDHAQSRTGGQRLPRVRGLPLEPRDQKLLRLAAHRVRHLPGHQPPPLARGDTSQTFFRQLDANGYPEKESVQLYCEHDQMSSADRYVGGTRYVCGCEKARGDECPDCGTWIDPLAGRVRFKSSAATPRHKGTRHWYLNLPKLRDDHIGDWIQNHEWKPNAGLHPEPAQGRPGRRSITRDLKAGCARAAGDRRRRGRQGALRLVFDAPIGYASARELTPAGPGGETGSCGGRIRRSPRAVPGKDNIPFHCLVFPRCQGTRQDYVLPWQVPANEFYNMEAASSVPARGAPST